MQRNVEWYEHLDCLHGALERGGAFLTVNASEGRANPMTIGWGQVGMVWNRPVFTVLVRESRYTYNCICEADAFTISVPRAGDFSDALALCGSRSGRELDKVAEAGLTLLAGQAVAAPVIEGCLQYYECRILARTQQARPNFASTDVLNQFYRNGDHHLVVFGEIVAAYAEEA